MSDVLTAPDDMFWPPTQRTEAESPEVAMLTQSWIFGFLGSRVRSYSPAPDRVVVWCSTPPAVDAFTLPAADQGSARLYSSYGHAAHSWDARPITFVSRGALIGCEEDHGFQPASNPAVESEQFDLGDPEDVATQPDLDEAVSSIKRLLGLTDQQLEAATGVSRSTLWRLRTGRTGESKSVTEVPIWRLHSLARALVDRIGLDGTRGWLHAGEPSPAELLSTGEISGVERAANRVLFPDAAGDRRASSVSEDDYGPTLPLPVGAASATKRPRRARRPGDRPR